MNNTATLKQDIKQMMVENLMLQITGDERRRLPGGTTEPTTDSGEVAPLLKKLLRDYAATGLPPGYLPLDRRDPNRKEEE